MMIIGKTIIIKKKKINSDNTNEINRATSSKITIKDSKLKLKSLISKVFKNYSDEKILSKDDQIETLMQMYKDLEKQLHQERAERKKEEENLKVKNMPDKQNKDNLSKQISENDNEQLRSWKKKEKLNKLDDSSESERSVSPHFFRTPKINTSKIWRNTHQSDSISTSRSRSPFPNARDKTRIKALREASKNALFSFKGRTDISDEY
jgi:hypothetical protein